MTITIGPNKIVFLPNTKHFKNNQRRATAPNSLHQR